MCFWISRSISTPCKQNNRNLPQLPDSSVDKESACNAGDPGSSPGSGRSPGEGKGYPLQYSWASVVAQLVKNPPSMRETWVQSLCWEDPLEKGMATHSSILAWRIRMDRGACWAAVHGIAESDMTEELTLSLKPKSSRAGAPRQEKPPQWETHPLQWRESPSVATRPRAVENK